MVAAGDQRRDTSLFEHFQTKSHLREEESDSREMADASGGSGTCSSELGYLNNLRLAIAVN